MFEQLRYPIIQAPMAGGISTVELALAVSKNGGLGFLAAGYKTPEALEQELITCTASNLPFGVNLFVPSNDAVDESIHVYYQTLAEDFHLNLELAEPNEDHWHEKLALVIRYNVPFVSFTFGCPTKEEVHRLKNSGSRIIITVTNETEARLAEEVGADAICVQGVEAGGHRATFQNVEEEETIPLVNLIWSLRQKLALPIIAAGGIMNGQDIQLLLAAGANAVQLGTAFLCTEESGANPVYKQALQSGQFTETTMTRAFTGRRARGLNNAFIQQYEPLAPSIYPAVHYLTQPIRRQALAEENPQHMSLWAGVRFKEIKVGTVDDVFREIILSWEQVSGGNHPAF